MYHTSPTGAVQSFSIGAVVGITAVVTGTIALTVGLLAGVLVYHCIHYYRSQSSKTESSFHQQHKAVSACNPLQQTGPDYEEVVELRRNRSYEFRKNFEMREDTSMYHDQSQSSEPESSSHQQQQTTAVYEKPMPAPSNDGKIDLRANVAYEPIQH